MEGPIEKRRSKRERFEGKVEIYPLFPSYSEKLEGTHKGFFEAFGLDRSWSGVGLRTGVSLKVGSFIKLQLAMAGQTKFEIMGQVAWARDSFCGVSFISFADN